MVPTSPWMLAIWAPVRTRNAARPRLLLQVERASGGWIDALASREDLIVDRTPRRRARGFRRHARGDRERKRRARSHSRAAHERFDALPVVLVLENATDPAAREEAFLAGAATWSSPTVRTRPGVLDAAFFAARSRSTKLRHRVRLDVEPPLCPGTTREKALIDGLSASGAQVRFMRPPLIGTILRLWIPLSPDHPPLETWVLVRGVASRRGRRTRAIRRHRCDRAHVDRAMLDGLERDTRSTDPADAFQHRPIGDGQPGSVAKSLAWAVAWPDGRPLSSQQAARYVSKRAAWAGSPCRPVSAFTMPKSPIRRPNATSRLRQKSTAASRQLVPARLPRGHPQPAMIQPTHRHREAPPASPRALRTERDSLVGRLERGPRPDVRSGSISMGVAVKPGVVVGTKNAQTWR